MIRLMLLVTVLATIAARGESLAAFDGRCIPAGGVAPRSHTPGILGRRALPAWRLARLDATPDFHHGLLRSGAGDVLACDVGDGPGAAVTHHQLQFALKDFEHAIDAGFAERAQSP
jgi:hypothetical protein